ncbi:MAG TPA: hypothetical protein EYO33_03975 [Phycisphaerales bacterium]|nr:hypothetical protein [Phycisphaerales bacterium]
MAAGEPSPLSPREVTPDVSGEPVLIELFERLVMRTHWRGIALSLLVMTVVLVVILRDTKDVLLAASPTAISLLLVMGLMGFLGWDFNPANFVAGLRTAQRYQNARTWSRENP